MEAIWDSLPPNVLAQSAPYEVMHNFEGATLENPPVRGGLGQPIGGTRFEPAAPDMVVKFAEDTSGTSAWTVRCLKACTTW